MDLILKRDLLYQLSYGRLRYSIPKKRLFINYAKVGMIGRSGEVATRRSAKPLLQGFDSPLRLMNKKNLFVWTLYDFANSIVSIVFLLYFSQWLVVDKGVSDLSYNLLFTLGSVLLLLTAPVFGSLADKTGANYRYLKQTTWLAFSCYLAVSLITLFASGEVFLAAAFFLFANYFYQFSFVFYNALLPQVASPDKWGKASGIGQAGNFTGQVAGLLLTMPLASGAVYLVGEVGRAQTLWPATVLFLLLALPMLLLFKRSVSESVSERVSLKEEYRSQWKAFLELIKDRNMKFFLLAYFFFNDAIITISNNFPIYLENVFAAPDKLKTYLLAGALLMSVFGALFSGFVTDRIGLKKSLRGIIGIWIIFVPILGLTTNFKVFMVLCVLMGFLFGAIWTITRASMAALTPRDQMNYGFSFYTLAERTSTLVGPVSWGVVTYIFSSFGATRYRLAMLCMAGFVAIGFYLVRKVNFVKVN